jgi:probable phosphoglycerate mutase
VHAVLIRHAEHALQDQVLVGRSPGVHLTTRGLNHARAIGCSLGREHIARVQSSPSERCVETAEEIAAIVGVPVEIESALDEIDVGAWTGATFTNLENDPDWRAWNELRSLVRPPGGESMQQAQQRIVRHLLETAKCTRASRVAMVTHAEIIRAAMLHARRLPLDSWNSIAIAPGEIVPLTVVEDVAA